MTISEIIDRLRAHRARLGETAFAGEDCLGASHPLMITLGDRLIEADEIFLAVQAYDADAVTREALEIATRKQ
jgi:hypothetical protein